MTTERIDKIHEGAKAIVRDLSQRGWANNLDLELAMTNCLSKAIDEFVLEEREACAKIAESIAIGVPMVVRVSTDYHEKEMESLKTLIAKYIRGRSQDSSHLESDAKERDSE